MTPLSPKALRCLAHYISVYSDEQQRGDTRSALDECIQHFLDQRPGSKGITSLDRAIGLAAAPFWHDVEAVNTSSYAALALSHLLRFETALSDELLNQLVYKNPEVLRWAIRYSKLFTQQDSPVWKRLRPRLVGTEWQAFLAVCDRLLEQLQPFDQLIETAERQVAHLSLLETLSYLSVLAYERLTPENQSRPEQSEWKAYTRIITNKLKTCGDRDFALTENRLGQSLKQHLSPILFPSPSITQSCLDNLEAFALLIAATQERMDYEGSIDWFCFDPECCYQIKPGESVIYNQTDQGSIAWQRTERKVQALWHYWINRGFQAFLALGMDQQQIGSAENHERNTLAYAKALRSALQLQEIYGLEDEIELANAGRTKLFHILLASELHSVFFQSAYIQPFQQNYAECGIVAQALGKLAFEGLVEGENRFPMTWSESDAKVKRIVGWTVCPEHPHGSELAAKAILEFWTNDLNALATTLKQQPLVPIPTLYERPFYKIGRYNFQFPWVVAQQNNLTAAVNNLRRIGARRKGQLDETRRIERQLAELLRQRGFAVEVGYRPPRTDNEDPGEIDLICHRDGELFLLEVKSGYIRSTTHEIWLHRTKTLRKAAWQLKRKRTALLSALERDDALCGRLGYSHGTSEVRIHAWIVDSSIELDGQRVDGYSVVSLESLHVILRDERHLLCATEQLGNTKEVSLFPDGFTATQFAHVVDTGEIWANLEQG